MVRSKGKTAKANQILVTHSYPESVVSDQVRMILTNLNFLINEERGKIILVTSSGESEGKSIVAANLAVCMAQQKKKVLLIDTNFRKPNLSELFQISNSCGLIDVLTGRMSYTEAIHHTTIWRLDLLNTGPIPSNPLEFFDPKMIGDLLEKVKDSYDIIMLDSAAILNFPETKLLANQCDGVLLVVKNGGTKLQNAFEAKKVIKFSKANLVGVILNQ
ncbi:CpsD/CapB family tyrosine-protein kinase [Neobacillus terrae]|uniref:CpsD/CapB family tyrosine-protein kinase n=1 Tax=Neobacillus terrae TaxID=3034837 RepID=UPI001409AA1F|nr:CpsD/CapB family tyrosine-protein kinase [Neobacillus terrae]NHM29252.1 CpsD/CapB family tyrosine-protein kinase [Neobacillus terrae]